MPLRVTFDTNVLDLACRPERFPKDPRQPSLGRVHDALKNGEIEGFYSVTMLTIEGVMKRDRAQVYGNTRIAIGPETISTLKAEDIPVSLQERWGGQDIEQGGVEFRVEQPDRQPLHPEVQARARAAHALGIRALKAPPRTGAFHIHDDEGSSISVLELVMSLSPGLREFRRQDERSRREGGNGAGEGAWAEFGRCKLLVL